MVVVDKESESRKKFGHSYLLSLFYLFIYFLSQMVSGSWKQQRMIQKSKWLSAWWCNICSSQLNNSQNLSFCLPHLGTGPSFLHGRKEGRERLHLSFKLATLWYTYHLDHVSSTPAYSLKDEIWYSVTPKRYKRRTSLLVGRVFGITLPWRKLHDLQFTSVDSLSRPFPWSSSNREDQWLLSQESYPLAGPLKLWS